MMNQTQTISQLAWPTQFEDNLALCSGTDCPIKQTCARHRLIEFKQTQIPVGKPWAAHKMCRPSEFEQVQVYHHFLDFD